MPALRGDLESASILRPVSTLVAHTQLCHLLLVVQLDLIMVDALDVAAHDDM